MTFQRLMPAACKKCLTTEKPHKAHGFCDTCYRQWRKQGCPQDIHTDPLQGETNQPILNS